MDTRYPTLNILWIRIRAPTMIHMYKKISGALFILSSSGLILIRVFGRIRIRNLKNKIGSGSKIWKENMGSNIKLGFRSGFSLNPKFSDKIFFPYVKNTNFYNWVESANNSEFYEVGSGSFFDGLIRIRNPCLPQPVLLPTVGFVDVQKLCEGEVKTVLKKGTRLSKHRLTNYTVDYSMMPRPFSGG